MKVETCRRCRRYEPVVARDMAQQALLKDLQITADSDSSRF